MVGIAIQVVACLLTVLTAGLVFRLHWLLSRRLAWTLIAVAVLLLALTQAQQIFVHWHDPLAVSLTASLAQGAVAVLMFVGMLIAFPYFDVFHRTRTALRFSEAMYRSLVETLPMHVLCKQLDGKIAYANQSFCALVGKRRDEIIGLTDFDLFPENLAAKYRTDDAKVIAARKPVTLIEPNTVEGRRRMVEVTKAPIVDDVGLVCGLLIVFSDVTTRAETEEALRHEQSLLKTLMDSALDSIYFKDVEGRFQRINKTLADRFGLSNPREAIGKTDADFFSTEHAREARKDEQHILSTRTPIIAKEEKEIWTDGSATWVSTTKVPLLDALNNVVGTIGISRDITHRKLQEVRLQQSEHRLKAILDNTAAVIYLKDRAGRYQLVNRRYLEIFHFNLDEILGKTDYDLFPKEAADAFRANDLAVIESRRALEIEEKAPQDDGEHTYLTLKFPMLDEEGQVAGVCGFSTDITDRIQYEHALQESEARKRAIFEASMDGMIILGPLGQIMEFNPAAERIFGAKRSEVLGQSFMKLLAGDDVSAAAALLQLQGSTARRSIQQTALRQNGEPFLAEMVLRPIVLEGASLFAVFLRDITEKHKADELIQAKNRDLQTLLHVVAHDLKEPTKSIDDIARLLLDRPAEALDGRTRELLDRIHKNADRSSRLIDDITLLGKAQRTIHPTEYVPAAELVNDALDQLKEGRDPPAKVEVAGDLPTLLVDRRWATEAVMHLLSNALKFTVAGRPAEVSVIATEDRQGIVVRDRGIGVPTEHQERIFQLFQRGVGREVQGTGAGLAIVRAIAEQHGGRVFYRPRPAGGSEFHLQLSSTTFVQRWNHEPNATV